jgi:hypothetical protein
MKLPETVDVAVVTAVVVVGQLLAPAEQNTNFQFP